MKSAFQFGVCLNHTENVSEVLPAFALAALLVSESYEIQASFADTLDLHDVPRYDPCCK